MRVEVGDLLVVRFAPISVEKLIDQAEDEAESCRLEGIPILYSISTVAIQRSADEEQEESLLHRVCRESTAGGRTIFVTAQSVLEENGFGVRRSEPPTHHHDVIFGINLHESDVNRLHTLFETGRRKNPAWPK
ncbi:hypothetical protein OHV05_18830 [Kitasatospora sp. NBC_00070]|uniref:hypothetical protein n=1 Tax=Kitasatospora sp. NBC_00070 TaxID=2975962 RepID=UPI0032498C70